MAREVASKVLDGINDLVIMAPIREGFIHAYEPVTYATRLRIISEALNDIRATAREFETQVPFADASERILSLLDFKAGIIDNELLQYDPRLKLTARRYFYLIATFDGVWEPYMRMIWHPLGSLLDLLFANCEGYVFAQDNSFEDYITWVRSAQVDSAVFFTSTGVTVSDQFYLRKLEALQRMHDPVAGDLELARLRLINPGEEAARVRSADPFTAHRLALEALGVFYRLADFYPPLSPEVAVAIGQAGKGEAHLLQRAVHQILDGWDYRQIEPMLVPGAPLDRFKVLVDWYKSGESAFGQSAFPSVKPHVPDPALDRSEVQAGILSPLPVASGAKITHGALVMLSVDDVAKAPDFIGELLRQDVLSFEGGQPSADGFFRTIGVTANGLRRLRVRRDTVRALPKEFREGLQLRAPNLGDVWLNHPRNWRLPQRVLPAGSSGPVAPVEMEEVDLALVVKLASDPLDSGAAARLGAEIARLVQLAELHGCRALAVEAMENHFDAEGRFRDHFGLRDNISQPRPDPAAEPDFAQRIGPKRDEVRIGELLCGYANDRQDEAPAADEHTLKTTPNEKLDWGIPSRKQARRLQKNGSYLVIRKMSQDVAAFEAFKQANAAKLGGDTAALVGKLLGRHPDGPSLVTPNAEDFNDFDYSSDPDGARCPFASHIRRANPRRVEHDRPAPRLLRAGMSYGPRYDDADPATHDAPRGLMFMAYNSSIAEQYETIQRWINGGNSSDVASANNDPLTGTPPRPDGKRTYRFEVGGKVVRTEIDRPFVRLEWGLYLLVPSRKVLQSLSQPEHEYYDSDEDHEEAGLRLITRLEHLPGDVASAEWNRLIEDFDHKDLSQRDLTPDVYSAVRYARGGLLRVPGGLSDKVLEVDETGAVDQARSGAVIAAGSSRILSILRDHEHFSVEEGLRRLVRTSGSIYVAQQPNGEYEDPALNHQWNYWAESTETNAIIDSYGYEDGFNHGLDAGKAVLQWMKVRTNPAAREFKMELRREYLAPALALCNRTWFGLPDGNFKEDGPGGAVARFMEPGDWDWSPARVPQPGNWSWETDTTRLPLCPGDCLSPSRHAFYPRSNRVSEALAINHGNSIREAGRQFAEYYFNNDKLDEVPGLISRRMFNLAGMTPELAARNVIGIMLGATPPTMGNLQGVFYDWLNKQTLWRHQGALFAASAGAPASYQQAYDALHEPLFTSMCRRPSPELLFRTCRGKQGPDPSAPVIMERTVRVWDPETDKVTVIEKDKFPIRKGDTVYLPLASATQRAITLSARDPSALHDGVNVIFGGERGAPDAPVHACPGRKLATGAMLGIVTALLEAGRIQAQPAGLIVRVSDWA